VPFPGASLERCGVGIFGREALLYSSGFNFSMPPKSQIRCRFQVVADAHPKVAGANHSVLKPPRVKTPYTGPRVHASGGQQAMNRSNEYFELLSNEGFRPDPEVAEDGFINFKSEGQLFGLYIPDGVDETFVMLYHHISLAEDANAELCISIANEINKTKRGVRCWYESEGDRITVAYEGFYCDVNDFAPFLVNLLSDLRKAKFEFLDTLDGFDQAVSTFPESTPLDVADEAAGTTGSVLLRQFGETDNKVRWVARTGETTFDLYIPKWRVPKPWPERIAVTTSLPIDQDLTRFVGGLNEKVKDKTLPITSIVDRVSDHTKTVRFRPRGEAADWEIGEPYIPYVLLPKRDALSVIVEVRWVNPM
jgi:hypothetical protein